MQTFGRLHQTKPLQLLLVTVTLLPVILLDIQQRGKSKFEMSSWCEIMSIMECSAAAKIEPMVITIIAIMFIFNNSCPCVDQSITISTFLQQNNLVSFKWLHNDYNFVSAVSWGQAKKINFNSHKWQKYSMLKKKIELRQNLSRVWNTNSTIFVQVWLPFWQKDLDKCLD